MANRKSALKRPRLTIDATRARLCRGLYLTENEDDWKLLLLKAANSLLHAKFVKACRAGRVRDVELFLASNPPLNTPTLSSSPPSRPSLSPNPKSKLLHHPNAKNANVNSISFNTKSLPAENFNAKPEPPPNCIYANTNQLFSNTNSLLSNTNPLLSNTNLHPSTSTSASVDLDAPGNDHKTALYHAIASAKSALLVKLLLRRGADPHRRSFVFFRVDCSAANFESCDEPPVVTAARVGSAEIVSVLLAAGADAAAQSDIPHGGGRVRGASALHYACDAADVELTRVLIGAAGSAGVEAEDFRGDRPLHVAARCKAATCAAQLEIIEALCGYGGASGGGGGGGKGGRRGADVEALNRKDCSPLYLAALYGCTAKAEALLRHGAAVDGATPVERSCGYGWPLHVAAYKDRLALAALLVCAGARLDRRNAAGHTPLSFNISAHAKSEIASLLIYHGARLDTLMPRQRPGEPGVTLLAACIGSMRLDCESLAVLMVQAGYELGRELWLVPEHLRDDYSLAPAAADEPVPDVRIAPGRVRRLCDWLRRVQSNPRRLSELCRGAVRRRLAECSGGASIVAGVGALPLPGALRNFVLLKDAFGNMERAILDYLMRAAENGSVVE